MGSELALLESKLNLKLGSVEKSWSVWTGCPLGSYKRNAWDCSG